MTKKEEEDFILNPITPLKANSQRLFELYLILDKDEAKRLVRVIREVNEDVIKDLKKLLER